MQLLHIPQLIVTPVTPNFLRAEAKVQFFVYAELFGYKCIGYKYPQFRNHPSASSAVTANNALWISQGAHQG